MTIGQYAKQAGVAASAIRYYEQVGLLPKPPRAGGRRRYSPDALPRLSVILLAQACGFRLDEIRRLLHGFRAETPPPERWRTFAAAKEAELRDRIRQAHAMLTLLERVRNCRCPDMAECGRKAARFLPAAE